MTVLEVFVLSKLFKHLATRLTNENDLSDLTWAIAVTNPVFLETFMEVFKFQEFKPGEPAEIMREVQTGDSRPDFMVTQGEKRFVIENKIWDRQHHFEQYATTFPGAPKALISAYKLSAEEQERANNSGFKQITWRGMVDLLEDKLSREPFDDGGIVAAYAQFVKEVCTFMELKQVKIEDGVRSLHAFTRLAAWVFMEGFTREGFTCTKYEAKRAFGECWAGQYGKLSWSQNKPALYPLLGMDFNIDKDGPAIVVWIEEDWNKSVYEESGELAYSTSLFDYRKCKDYGFLEFKLKDNAFDAFFSKSLEGQKGLLLGFFSAVVDEVALHS